MLRTLFLVLLFSFIAPSLPAQSWLKKMNDPSVNFYAVQADFQSYWKRQERQEKWRHFFSSENKSEEENESVVVYQRWADFVGPRVFPSGDRSQLQQGAAELSKLINSPAARSAMMSGGNWTPLGASYVPSGGGGAGRLNCIRFHPANPAIWYAGAPAGGLWKTTNSGASWTTATDQLPTLGVSDVAVDPANTNVMYLGTGDCDASDSHGVGVLKSVDGGITWSSTGLNFTVVQGRNVNRVNLLPGSSTIVFAATSVGLFRSSDAGVTWVRILSVNNIRDLEFKPTDPTIVYACSGTGFYRSTNAGLSFSLVATGLPFSTTVNRLAIAVTPADPSLVYVVYSDNSSSGFKGLYRSNDSGQSFNLMADEPNLLGWDPNGGDSGGQGWYTLSIAASPINPDEIVVGGVNVWRSYDGGSSWDAIAHWYGAAGLPYVHADIHDLAFYPGTNNIYAACDGGLFLSTDDGASFIDGSDGMQIGQMYRLGCAATDPALVIQGWQDNGCNLYAAGNWDRVLGGDGMEAFIDWSDAAFMYGESQNGGLSRSSNYGASFNGITSGITEDGNWVTPWCQDPITPTTLYAGFKNVWKSTNRGTSWTPISTFNSSGLSCLAVAPSDPNYIYASNGSTIYKTTDGGANWTTVSYPLSGTATVSYIAVSAADPNRFWITRSGYSNGVKTYRTDDGGANWLDLALNLPNIPVNCVVSQTGTNNGVYIGTDLGVYYTDDDQYAWMPYNNGLPNVIVDELEIQYSSGKLRAATYGRGLWETTMYDPSSPKPFANFAADSLMGCPGLTVHFADSTLHNPTAWNWTFPGGSPASSNLPNPTVVYSTAGTFNNVKLVVSNSFGTDSIEKYSYIAISPKVQPIITLNNNDSLCSGQSVNMASSYGYSYHWSPGNQTVPSINTSSTGVFSVTVTDAYQCPVSSAPQSIYVFPVPPTPVITQSGDTLYSNASTGNQWYLNGTAIPGATDSSYVMLDPGSYQVVVTIDSSHCSFTSNTIVGINDLDPSGLSWSVYPNPGNDLVDLTFQTDQTMQLTVQLIDAMGKLVQEKSFRSIPGVNKLNWSLDGVDSGVYVFRMTTEKGVSVRKLMVKK